MPIFEELYYGDKSEIEPKEATFYGTYWWKQNVDFIRGHHAHREITLIELFLLDGLDQILEQQADLKGLEGSLPRLTLQVLHKNVVPHPDAIGVRNLGL